ncbi:MAG: BTAD domain-containing putative transcriptional regulator [Methylobacterium frigidaeris]
MVGARLNLLGGFEMQMRGGTRQSLQTRKAELLLAYLALRPERPQRREKLAAMFWEDSSEAQARASLRQALSIVRRAFPGGPPVIDGQNDRIALSPDAVTTDVGEFERAIEIGSARDLTRAVVLYQGDFLEGLNVRSFSCEAWLHGERHRLRTLAIHAMLKLLNTSQDPRAEDAHVALALRILVLDPTQEPVHQALIRLHARRGHLSEAIRQYKQCRDTLVRELGVEPDAETENLYRSLLLRRQSPPPHQGGGRASASQDLRRRSVDCTVLGAGLDQDQTAMTAASATAEAQ